MAKTVFNLIFPILWFSVFCMVDFLCYPYMIQLYFIQEIVQVTILSSLLVFLTIAVPLIMFSFWWKDDNNFYNYDDSYTLRIEGATNGLSSKACSKIIDIARRDTKTHEEISLTINDANEVDNE